MDFELDISSRINSPRERSAAQEFWAYSEGPVDVSLVLIDRKGHGCHDIIQSIIDAATVLPCHIWIGKTVLSNRRGNGSRSMRGS